MEVEKIKRIYRFVRRMYHKYLFILISFIPLNEYCIVMESEGDFTDNPKAFYDYLIENGYNSKYKIVWFVKEPHKYKREKNVVFISNKHRFLNVKSVYYIATSKYFIFSHPWWLENWKKNQVVIHTSHSIAQLKAADGNKSIKRSDYLLCCSDYCAEIKKKVTGVTDSGLLKIGMPRLDLMFHHTDCISKLVKNYKAQEVILSMSTFKQAKGWIDGLPSDPFAINVIKTQDELRLLDQFLFDNNCILIVKIHHLQDMSYIKLTEMNNIHYITDDDLLKLDIQVNQLLENAEVLLTDYSSVFYDYLIKDRPIGFMLGDFSDYTRGFIMDDPLSEMPGEKIYNLEMLFRFIKEVLSGVDKFAQEREVIKKKVFDYLDDRNSERLYQFVENVKEINIQ